MAGEEVEAALRSVVEQRIQAAVDAEQMPQEQVDDVLAAYDDGDPFVLLQRLLLPQEEAERSR